MVKINQFKSVPLFVALTVVVSIRVAASYETSMGLWVGKDPVTLNEGQVFISKVNESIRLWCETKPSTTAWTMCVWQWKEIPDDKACALILEDGVVSYNRCNGTLEYIGGRCEVKIPAIDLKKHEGDWKCTLRMFVKMIKKIVEIFYHSKRSFKKFVKRFNLRL